MTESNYWKRWNKRRLSRRRLLAGAASVGTGLAALSLVGCGGDEEAAVTATPAASPGVTPTPTATPFPLEAVKAGSRGGVLRFYGFDAMTLDTYDPHQTQFGPIFSMHGAVFSKLLKYMEYDLGTMEADLAETMPETPDELTYIIKIRPNVRFHNTEATRKNFPQVAGRQLTAEDVKYSIERQINKESPKSALYYRAYQWETVDKIEVVDDLTLRITTKRPTAPFVHYLGDINAFIIAKELVDPAEDDIDATEKMVGTGPFMLDQFLALQVVRCARNPDWFAKDDLADIGLPDRPIVDAYEAIWTPQDDTAIEAAFKSKQIDWTGYVDRRNTERIAAEVGAKVDSAITSGWVNSRVLAADSDQAETPLEDLRLRQAINIAMDRNRIGQQLFQDWWILQTPVGTSIRNWALPLEELTKKPGFRFKADEREADLAEAKRLWEAAGGTAIESLEVVYAGIPEYLKNLWPQFERMALDTLGLRFEGILDPTGYTRIAQCALQKSCVLTLNYDNGWLDLDDWVYPYFHSTGSKNSFNVSDPALDRMLEAQRAEFDVDRRRQLGYDIQHYLLDNIVARLDWVCDEGITTRWLYHRNRHPDPWFGNTHHFANEWLDHSHPDFEGRPI
jgi:peptide/nickel transport system substrate-binding protein